MKKIIPSLSLVLSSFLLLTSTSCEDKKPKKKSPKDRVLLNKLIASKDKAKGIGNLKILFVALTEFENEHSVRPGKMAAEELSSKTPESINDIVKQLSGVYPQIMNLDCSDIAYIDEPRSRGGAPVAISPVDSTGKLDFWYYNGKAIILRSDGSVNTLDINQDTGKAEIEINGKMVDILSEENPAFRAKPRILYPKTK